MSGKLSALKVLVFDMLGTLIDWRGANKDMQKALRAFDRSFDICAEDLVALARRRGARA